jgi:hypothetical protein
MGFFLTLVYLALSLLRPAELFPALSTYHLMGALAGLAALGTALHVFGGQGPSFRSPQLYFAAAFVAWAGVSVFAAQRWLGGALQAIEGLATNGFLLLLIALNVDSLLRLEWTRRVLILFALWLVVQGGAAFFFHYGETRFIVHQRPGESLEATSDRVDDEDSTLENGVGDEADTEPSTSDSGRTLRRMRSLGFLQDPNDLAQLLAGILPLVLLEWRSRRRARNIFLVMAPAALIVGGIALTRSRGGLVAVAAMALAAAFYFGNRIVSALLALASGVGLMAGLALVRIYVHRDESSLGRVEAWYQGLQMLKGSPLWGVGYGNFTDFNPLVAHNSFIHCLAELGVVGYFFWMGMLVVTFHDLSVLSSTTRTEKAMVHDVLDSELCRWARACGFALVGFLAGAFFLSRTYSTTLFIFLALPTALASVARRSGRSVAPFSPVGWTLGIAVLQAVTLIVVYGIVRLVG